jgi:hypothetical protein
MVVAAVVVMLDVRSIVTLLWPIDYLELDDNANDQSEEDSSDNTDTSDGDGEATAAQVTNLERCEQIIQDLINEANIEGVAGPIDPAIQDVISKVLGDAFHVMQRIKVPEHNDFKYAYFRGLRGAILLLDAGYVARVTRVLERKRHNWRHVLAYAFVP